MISIVIPSLNSPLIDRVVAALVGQTARDQIGEIIVVGQDQAGLVPAAARLIASERPLAAAAARNRGAAAASGDLLLFLDADCLAAPTMVERLLARQRQGAAAVSAAVQIDPADRYWRLCDNLLAFSPFLSDAPAGPRRYLPSMALCLPRADFLACGGFAERYAGAAGEDLDLCLRLARRGLALHCETAARVRHCPPRASAAQVWAHLRGYGRAHVAVERDHGRAAAPRLSGRMRPLGGLIMAAAPLLALADGLRLLAARPALRRYWWALPGLAWAKSGWYWGVVEGLHTYV